MPPVPCATVAAATRRSKPPRCQRLSAPVSACQRLSAPSKLRNTCPLSVELSGADAGQQSIEHLIV